MAETILVSPIDKTLLEIGMELKATLPCAQEIIIFGSSEISESPGDVDIAAIIPDDIEVFDATSALAPTLANLTARTGLLISCFPINISHFNDNKSQFIQNIRLNGRSI
ncbi:hypothetical protein [Methylobacterium terrae]|uniref:hypothetical protein n=1 Tax=Methylobacterium terrae TaxID=2202827 RepID=UPI0013A57567|nr:hypothetical protein [Methylobacterium terrae]